MQTHKDSTVTLKIPVSIGETTAQGSYFLNTRMSGFFYSQGAKARNDLREAAGAILEEGLDAIKFQSVLSLIGSVAGDVFAICRRNGCWGYIFYGPTRKHAGSGGVLLSTEGTYKDIVAAARSHAEESFGGIAWENIYPEGLVFERS